MLYLDQLSGVVDKASMNEFFLVILSGQQAQSSDLVEYETLDLNRLLSERLIEMSEQDRPELIASLMTNIINEAVKNIVLITGLEILFDRSLKVDPIRLLRVCVKNKTLLASWPGDQTSSGLIYASPSHPEYRKYKTSDLSDVIILTADAQLNLKDANEIR